MFLGFRDGDNICCRALTAECLSCTSGMSISEYCASNLETVGCEGMLLDITISDFICVKYTNTVLYLSLWYDILLDYQIDVKHEADKSLQDSASHLETPSLEEPGTILPKNREIESTEETEILEDAAGLNENVPPFSQVDTSDLQPKVDTDIDGNYHMTFLM